MMDDYIKRSDAVHALCKAVHKDDGKVPCENQTASCLWSKTRVCDYAREIDALPSSDIVDVVRCKDCVHYMPYDWMFSEVWESQNIEDYPQNEIGCEWIDHYVKPDDFCSFAERKKDG